MLLKLLKAISRGPSTIQLDTVSANVRPFEFDVQSITLTEGRLSTAVTTGALQLLLIIIFPLSFHIIIIASVPGLPRYTIYCARLIVRGRETLKTG